MTSYSDLRSKPICTSLPSNLFFAFLALAKGESFIALANSMAELALKHTPDTLEELVALPYEGGMSISEKLVEQIGVIGEKLVLWA